MPRRGRAVVLAGLAAAGLAVFCLSDGGSTGFSVDAVQAAADRFEPHTTVCPLRFDHAAALKAAGISGTLTPSFALLAGTTPQDGSLIFCQFEISTGGSTSTLSIVISAVRTGQAWNQLALYLRRDGLSGADVQAYYATPIPAGSVRITPGAGSAAVGRPIQSGPGDVAIEFAVSVRDEGTSPLAGRPLQRLAQELLNTASL